MVLELEPKFLWKIFHQISLIPRETEKEQKIAGWIVSWSKEKNLDCFRDEIGNICIRKKSSNNLQKLPMIGLQVHMDMVCVREPTSLHNFDTDPLDLYLEENHVRAKGTSLGADNGIGLSIALALLVEPILKTFPLEVIITVEEEKKCRGAQLISPDFFKSKTIINLDSTTFGEIIIGSVGMLVLNIIAHPESQIILESCQCIINLSGLKGGHSGLNVNSAYLNAIRSIDDFLIQICKYNEIQLVSFEGGDLYNNIPSSAKVSFLLSLNQLKQMQLEFENWSQRLKSQSSFEPNLTISCIFKNVRNISAISTEQTSKIIHLLHQIPNGVIAYSPSLPNTVESSVQLGTIQIDPTSIRISLIARSMINTYLEDFFSSIQLLCTPLNGVVEILQKIPAWNGNSETNLVKLMIQKHISLFKNPPLLKAIHAGMESSYFFNKANDISIIALGATISNIHSVEETVDIDSVKSLYVLLREFLGDHELLNKLKP